MNRFVLPAIWVVLLAPVGGHANPSVSTELPPAMPLPEVPFYPETPLPPEPVINYRLASISELSRTGNFGTLDLSNRELSAAFYNSIYTAPNNTAMGWSGDASSCDAGDTSNAFKNAVLVRINWYRAMAGVPNDVTFYTGAGSYSDKAQDAALMMSRNNALSHNPPNSWNCYSSSGDEAAGKSNISLGNDGWDAVNSQVTDNGTNNAAAGHRRWILYPQTRMMGTGDIPNNDGYNRANSLWVFDSHYSDPRPSTRDTFVAWPPPGYVPYQVVPPRWSFSYPSADFSAATVSMTQAGQPVDITLEPVTSGYGENTLVWVAAGLDSAIYNESWPAPQSDTLYNVSIENVKIGGSYTDFDYQVTVFDPTQQSVSALDISGPTQLSLSGTGFTHETLGFGDAYQLRELVFTSYQGDEDAEDGGLNIVDNTDAAYDLITTQTSASGNHSFHLAHTSPATQSFELDRSFVLGSNSNLLFSSRLGWATDSQTARVQISINDGASWSDLYSQSGSNSSGESGFTSRSISLNSYANRVARLRVIYEVNGSYYYQSSGGVGFYIDSIGVTDAQEMGAVTLTTLGTNGSFTYTPSSAGEYGLQIQSVPWNGFSGLDWGPVHRVTVVANGGNSGCDGDNVTISSSFQAGQSITCTATSSIDTSGTVQVPAGASVRFNAPLIHLSPGFRSELGASFSAGQ